LDEVFGPVGVAGVQVEAGEDEPARPADQGLERPVYFTTENTEATEKNLERLQNEYMQLSPCPLCSPW
jgi:hypothetical protein